MVIIYINIVELEFPMQHAKFEYHRTSGSGEEDFLGFYHTWACWPSWSCDLDFFMQTLCLFIILLVQFWMLSGHLLGNSCPLG